MADATQKPTSDSSPTCPKEEASLTVPPAPPNPMDAPNRLQVVRDLFPDICPRYLEKEAVRHNFAVENLIDHLIDLLEKGGSYERARRKPLKRKREEGTVEAIKRRYCHASRPPSTSINEQELV